MPKEAILPQMYKRVSSGCFEVNGLFRVQLIATTSLFLFKLLLQATARFV